MSTREEAYRTRRAFYGLLIAVVCGMAIGRILAVERVYEPSLYKADENDTTRRSTWPSSRPPALPTFSSNDRSRWALIRALIDHGTFIIGERDRGLLEPSAASLLAATTPLEALTLAATGREVRIRSTRCTWQEDSWEPGWDTVDKALDPATQKFYSTKPPLLPVLVAGLYWLLQLLTGWTLATNVWEVVKTLLIVVNVVPFALYLWLFAGLVERFVRDDWSKLYLFVAACFGTLVTPFLVTLNNHTVATFSVLFALYPALSILTPRSPADGQKPPLYLFGLAGLFAAFAACNELPALAFTAGLGFVLLLRYPVRTLVAFVPAAAIPIAALLFLNYVQIGSIVPIYARVDTIWYKYEGSHWAYPPGTHRGIDYAKYHESHAAYIFHMLIGHHGLFSLTPMWLLAFAGMFAGPFIRSQRGGENTPLPWYCYLGTLLISAVVLAFYLFVVGSRNYGGWTCGLRWLMWLTPLWLLAMIPSVEFLSRGRIRRGIALALLAVSVLSVSFPAWNPWRHPWLYRWMDANQWLPY